MPRAPSNPPRNPGELINSFLCFGGFEEGVASANFSLQELTETLVRHIRDPDAKTSLAAIREFRNLTTDLANINGLVSTATVTRANETASVTITSTAIREAQRSTDQAALGVQYLPALPFRGPEEPVESVPPPPQGNA